jgi:hypothetical protein
MRPRVWHLALLGVLFASAAARSCAEFLRYGPYPAGEPYAFLFLACALLAGGPLVLASFRLWHGRESHGWPPDTVSARIAAAAVVVSLVAFGGVLPMACTCHFVFGCRPSRRRSSWWPAAASSWRSARSDCW